jgi:hypothetical protein
MPPPLMLRVLAVQGENQHRIADCHRGQCSYLGQLRLTVAMKRNSGNSCETEEDKNQL